MNSHASTVAFFEPETEITPSVSSIAYDGDSGAEYQSIDDCDDRASSTNGSAMVEEEKIGDVDKKEKSASDATELIDDEDNMVIAESALDETLVPVPTDLLKPQGKSQTTVAEGAVNDVTESLTPKEKSAPIESPAAESNESLTPNQTPTRKSQSAEVVVVDPNVSLMPEQKSASVEEIAVKPDDPLVSKCTRNLRSTPKRSLSEMSTPKRKRNKPLMPMQHPNILSTPKRKLLSGGDAEIERIMKQRVTVVVQKLKFDSILDEWILPENVEHTVTNARTAYAVEDDSKRASAAESTAKVIQLDFILDSSHFSNKFDSTFSCRLTPRASVFNSRK